MKKLLFVGALGTILLVAVFAKHREAIAPISSQKQPLAPAQAGTADNLDPLEFDQMGDIE
ncbi:hypothetical protein H6G00_05080 [Leptolyngbya sp. FACHB-541]|uniref:hypothetical protein n=1 Tax=Leptolyngbya sp. FACHB-541 TaxID=2692810 RepID=UPI00168295EE|nr:hypothetical protein [Leptolyngbya sp. FACHB-541]MBD1995989.1 hypothetical protein [Leptolyngbya sp. FACHB-541]